MVKIVIVCHGGLAEGLINAMELIAGAQEQVVAIQLDEQDPIDELETRVETAVQARLPGQEVLILVDLFGASPFNVSCQVANRNPGVEVISGVNLAMLLETALQHENSTLTELTAVALEAEAGSVKVLSKLMSLDAGGDK